MLPCSMWLITLFLGMNSVCVMWIVVHDVEVASTTSPGWKAPWYTLKWSLQGFTATILNDKYVNNSPIFSLYIVILSICELQTTFSNSNKLLDIYGQSYSVSKVQTTLTHNYNPLPQSPALALHCSFSLLFMLFQFFWVPRINSRHSFDKQLSKD